MNEVENRLHWVTGEDRDVVDAAVVQGLITMLDDTNELVGEFRKQRDRYEGDEIVDLEITLKVIRSESGRETHFSSTDEVAGIMVGDTEETCGERDIVVDDKIKGLVRVSYVHPKLMALQYLILFPWGEDGYHTKIRSQKSVDSSSKVRGFLSLKDYYSYSFQVRQRDGLTPRLGGRLFQQYLVDAFSTIEQTRLWWFRTHQTTIRNELYSHICDSIRRGDVDALNGSKRYMQQNFQDALAVCRHVGHPDIFLTMTSNPFWDKIQKMMVFVPGCITANCPDIVSRVFRLKLEQLMTDIKSKGFGVCNGVMYVVEFQKRGLPHVHMLIWLDSAAKKNLKLNVDKYVSAEIPDPLLDPAGYAAVKEFMIHGPCGLENLKSPCMRDFRCIRYFPKKYCTRTTFDESGFPIYMRRRRGVVVHVRGTDLDNQWVVPYSRDLLVKYQCHMNVEICCHARSLKYLFKYCLKGHDRATVYLNKKKRCWRGEERDQCEDEINVYFDGRYLCGAEAAYRIFGFAIHHRSISVERLPFHLPGDKNCTFRANESLHKVAAMEKYKLSKLEAFFLLNFEDIVAREHMYDEIPRYYVWNDGQRRWTPRKRGMQIGRLCYAQYSTGKPWYLRLLLTKVRGPTSFKSIQTVNGVCFSTFRDACREYGLLDDDKEWHEVLSQAAAGGLSPQIRQLFVHIIVNCKVTDLWLLWDTHWRSMIDDILLARREISRNSSLLINDMQLQFYVLAEIDELLRSIGKCLKKYDQLPQPPATYLNNGTNNLILEETSYNMVEMEKEYSKLLQVCTEQQRNVYDAVMGVVHGGSGGLFFVYGSGGCGKTFLWRTLISRLRSEGKILLPVASSGIAATLMPGGRTAHSRFKIPIMMDEFTTCNIAHDSDIAQLIKQTDLIIWDEAPMQHRFAFECLDRSLRDIMKVVDPSRFNMPFGGITVVLGGDFRQILHGSTDLEMEDLKWFAQWVLDIGNGNVLPPRVADMPYQENRILIPPRFCNSISYFSVDSAEEFGGTDEDLNVAFPVEYLNSLNVTGMLPHDLKLKVGVVVMLMRNLNQTLGLCNGTRMIVTKCLKFCVECEVICGSFVGTKHFIPRMELFPSDTKMPFKLVRKQMPLQVCYAMIINKSQGQSLDTVSLYLPKSVFTHGQYYVAVSRVTSPGGLTIFVDDDTGGATNITENVVYKEVFYDLPCV
ncbi:uncharacterized protein LOC141659973 [Apium graveolens]|uniref:uncharacterized protein LOC141659973 n=1 Tax=Apium graveolens TaxID=4045 RepID=UPI003D78CCD6